MAPMCKKVFFILFVCCLLTACKQAEREAARTRQQLGGVAKATGTDEMFDSVAKSYQENVHPLVRSAGTTIENVEALNSARALGAQACEKISDFGSDVGHAADRAMSRLPQNERELDQSIDYYNDQFVDWLRENFKGMDLSAKSERVKSRIEPRGKPKGKSR